MIDFSKSVSVPLNTNGNLKGYYYGLFDILLLCLI